MYSFLSEHCTCMISVYLQENNLTYIYIINILFTPEQCMCVISVRQCSPTVPCWRHTAFVMVSVESCVIAVDASSSPTSNSTVMRFVWSNQLCSSSCLYSIHNHQSVCVSKYQSRHHSPPRSHIINVTLKVLVLQFTLLDFCWTECVPLSC